MFDIGNYVYCSGNAVCKIKDIVNPDFVEDKEKLYYMIVPIEDESAKLYIPIENSNKKIRPVLNEEQVWKLINDVVSIDEMYVGNDKQREQIYKDALYSGDPRKLVSIIKTMYVRSKKRNEEGKKSTAIDERYFKIAENHLYSEIAFVLGKEKEEMKTLIANIIIEQEN